MADARVREYRYWPRAKPIPEGWEIADCLGGTIHNNLCTYEERCFLLLVREVKE